MLQTSLGKYLAPTSMGAGYAISKVLLLRWFDTELALLQDFTMQFLAGVLIGFSLRPVIKVIYWKPTTGFVMISLIMLVFGTLGNVLLNFVWGTPMDPGYWAVIKSEILTALVVGALALVLLPPPQYNISLGWIFRRLKRNLNSLILGKLLVCGGLQVLLFFGLQAWLDDTMTSSGFNERIQELANLPPLGLLEKILLIGTHGILTSLMVLLLCMFFLRSFFEQLVVIGSLAFVLGIFAPAFANFQQIEPLLLVDQIFIGLCRTFALVGFAVWMFRRPLE
ncbi:MAG: hypothetical protein ACJ0DH_06445 [bacterium]